MPEPAESKLDLNTLDDLVDRPLAETVDAVRRNFPGGSHHEISLLDRAVHFHYYQASDSPDEAARKQLSEALGEILDLPAVRAAAPLDAAARAAISWDHLLGLLQVRAESRPLIERAREFLATRQYGKELFDIVRKAEESGDPITAGDLAKSLDRSPSTVSQVLSRLEEHAIILRRRVGGRTLVYVGDIGHALAAPPPAQERKLNVNIPNRLPASPWAVDDAVA